MSKPTFFLAGAPKSGTSALYRYLREHPEIFLPALKEPHFWCDDFSGIRQHRSLEEYLELFAAAGPGHRQWGDASVTYLASDVALARIAAFNPDARIVLLLRNPVDMVHAFHSELLWNQNEDEPDFATAWTLQERRRDGERIPALCREPKLLQYRKVAAYGEQLERLFAYFPRRQVRVYLYEEFNSSPRSVYEDLLCFLGVRVQPRASFSRVNENKLPRSRWAARLAANPPYPLLQSTRVMKRMLGVQHLGISKLYQRLNARPVRRPPLTASLRQMIADSFRMDVIRAERLLGRELRGWDR